MTKIILGCMLLAYTTAFSQNLDSLYDQLMQLRGIKIQNKIKQVTLSNQPEKCGFGIINDVKLNYAKFPPEQQKTIAELLNRPTTDTSIVTSNGKIRIHFNKTGPDSPTYDLNELSKAADSSYNFEVNIIGFPPPPKDNGAGGDDCYDIYIQSLGSGFYGYTELDQPIGDSTYTTFSVIDYNFGQEYYTHGITAAKVTVAHEFHHGIQMGNYIFRPADRYFHELTSVSMEKFVFDDIDDYIGYLGEYFSMPDNSFSSNNGYDLAIWNLFLKERFGFGIIKRTWELMPKERAIQTIGDAIQEKGSNFKVEFNTFGQWTYFTNERAIPGKYFKDAAKYPLIQPLQTIPFVKQGSSVTVNSEAVSNNFLFFNDNTNGSSNLIVSIISNCNISGDINYPYAVLPFTYNISSQQNAGQQKIVDGYYSNLVSSAVFLLSESDIFNNIPVDNGNITSSEIDYVFPQPFRYSKNSEICFPITPNGEDVAELYIYSINMNLVYSGQQRIIATDKIVEEWNGIASNGRRLATGVYFYVTKSNGQLKKGKFVVFND